MKIYHNEIKDLDDRLPDEFFVKFSNFNKNFTNKFARIKKDNYYPIGSNDIYTLDTNGNTVKHIITEDEVYNI